MTNTHLEAPRSRQQRAALAAAGEMRCQLRRFDDGLAVEASLQQVVLNAPASGPPTIVSSEQLLRNPVDAGVRPAWGVLRSDENGGSTP